MGILWCALQHSMILCSCVSTVMSVSGFFLHLPIKRLAETNLDINPLSDVEMWLRLPSTLENSRKLLSVLLHPLIFFRAPKPLKQNKHETENKNKQTRNLSVVWQIPSPGAEYEVNVLTIQNLISTFFEHSSYFEIKQWGIMFTCFL